ncbi:hypothetical protein RHGRI_016684 [Rhododendron griersonianum]|uniref:Uncharacterized protein n=1 Tax=Rhododendron griersonianum TaxID=479676 RepID=A0AAV6JV32_9ERIC|nr:hypothetical protein RHGRI_016684 [Rhododendron griersonianum]
MTEVLEDSFGEIPSFLLPSVDRPLRGKVKVAREETTDEEEGEEVDMAPRNILADLEKRKKEKEEAKAKTSSKTGPSAGGPSIRSTRSKGSSIQVPNSPTSKRPYSSTSQDKEVPKDTRPEKKQRTEIGSGGEGVLYHDLALPKDVTMPASLKSAIDDHYFHAGRV